MTKIIDMYQVVFAVTLKGGERVQRRVGVTATDEDAAIDQAEQDVSQQDDVIKVNYLVAADKVG